MINILNKNVTKIKRSNKIIYKYKYLIKYPFENELYKLPPNDRDKALELFLNNPYKNLKPTSMEDFFLKIFGKGIFDLYLKPYNYKIWKMRVSKLDTQMVERIPQPPAEDIIKSAKGEVTEGYKHQLYFHYPKKGGIENLFNAFYNKLDFSKVSILKKNKIINVKKKLKKYLVKTNNLTFETNKIVSTIPLNVLYEYLKVPEEIKRISKKLKYNSIIISIFNVRGTQGGDNFAFMIPDKDIIFHRISKLDFLGTQYSIKGTTTFQIEITYRKFSKISKMTNKDIYRKIEEGLKKLNYIKNKNDINFRSIKRFKYAYVIYDLQHRKNVDKLISYYSKKNIDLLGRWGSWEYLNSDQVIKQSKDLSEKLLKKIKKN